MILLQLRTLWPCKACHPRPLVSSSSVGEYYVREVMRHTRSQSDDAVPFTPARARQPTLVGLFFSASPGPRAHILRGCFEEKVSHNRITQLRPPTKQRQSGKRERVGLVGRDGTTNGIDREDGRPTTIHWQARGTIEHRRLITAGLWRYLHLDKRDVHPRVHGETGILDSEQSSSARHCRS